MKLYTPLLVTASIILVQLLCLSCNRPHPKGTASQGNSSAAPLPPLLKRNGAAGVYYEVPKCVTAQIKVIINEEHSVSYNSEDKGEITSFGWEVILHDKRVLWQNNRVYYNDKLYVDKTGKLTEYYQYIVFYHNVSNAEQFYVLLCDLEEKIGADGYLDVNKLSPDQRADVLESRQLRNKRRISQ